MIAIACITLIIAVYTTAYRSGKMRGKAERAEEVMMLKKRNRDLEMGIEDAINDMLSERLWGFDKVMEWLGVALEKKPDWDGVEIAEPVKGMSVIEMEDNPVIKYKVFKKVNIYGLGKEVSGWKRGEWLFIRSKELER